MKLIKFDEFVRKLKIQEVTPFKLMYPNSVCLSRVETPNILCGKC